MIQCECPVDIRLPPVLTAATPYFAPKVQRQRVPFAVPDKIFGLARSLDFIDRCTRCALALSATGSARARGPSGVPNK